MISVIIIAYDRKNYIINAIKSVLNQTLDKKYYEIIVIKNFNDSIIDKFIDDNNIINIYSNNKTIAGKMYEASKIAKGDIISFLEDDDLFFNNKLEYVYNLFKNNNNLVYYHNAIQYIDDYGNIINRRDTNSAFNTSSMSIKKDIINIKIMNNITDAIDTIIYCTAKDSKKKIISNRKILTYYRFHNSASNLTGDIDSILRGKIKLFESYVYSLVFTYNNLKSKNTKKICLNYIITFKLQLKILYSIAGINKNVSIYMSDIGFWFLCLKYMGYRRKYIFKYTKIIELFMPVCIKRLMEGYNQKITLNLK